MHDTLHSTQCQNVSVHTLLAVQLIMAMMIFLLVPDKLHAQQITTNKLPVGSMPFKNWQVGPTLPK
jgi:hypothetical protein